MTTISKKIALSVFAIIIILAFCMLTFFTPFDGKLFAASAKIKVFLDAGHGGSDPGAIGFGFHEKTANLDIALRVKSKLESSGFDVVMTRSNDSNRSLDEIVNMANGSSADLFVSIHNNASISPYSHGTETYWCANGVAGSNQLASLIQSNVVSQTGRANRGVKTANFRVIKNTTMPAALVECAFISNQTENDLLKSEAFREKCAVGIFNAIKKFSEGIIKPDSSGGSSGSTAPAGTDNGNSYSDVSGANSSGFTIKIDTPPNGAVVSGSFEISGWAADLRNSPAKKLSKIEVYKNSSKDAQNLIGSINSFETNVLGSEGVLNGGWKLTINCDLLSEGENILYIYAYDESNNSSVGNVKINVLKSGNVPDNLNLNPVAKPGGPYTGEPGKEITFNGSASFDPNGVISEYLWDFGDESTATTQKPVHIYTKAGNYTVTLTVKDNGAKSSAAVTTMATVIDPDATQTTEGNTGATFGNVSNSTNIIGYIDISEAALLKIFKDRSSTKLDRATRLAPLYIKYAKIFNIRADIAWAQMCHETSFLDYTGDVKPEQNNFAGIGATGGGVPGNSFASEELGVIAHFAHLAWYYYPNDINEYCNKTYDPRHFGTSHMNYTGDPTVGFLNGRWAPGATYTDKIILFANQVIQGIGSDSQVIPASVTANAGQDKEGNIGQNIDFDASSSIIQVTGDISVSYSWDWNGDGTYDNTVSTAVTKHIFETSGVFDVALKITLSNGLESIDKIKVTINKNPVADAGGPYTGKTDQSITFDGSKSTDSDGTISEYSWDFGDNSTVVTGQKPTHTFSTAGTYNIKLIVKDNKGAFSTESIASAIIEAEDALASSNSTNLAPTANAGGPYTGIAGHSITFDGSGSTDSDGSIKDYLWDFGDGASGSGISPTHTFEAAGTYIIELTVVDDKDLSSTTVTATAEVTQEINNIQGNSQTSSTDTTTETTGTTTTETTVPENNAPTAKPGGPYSGDAGATIIFDGSASSDPDGTIAEYAWNFGDGSTGTGAKPTHAYSTAGNYTVKLIVKDDKGLASTESTTAVTVNQVVVQSQYPVNTSIITNSTSILGYYEVTVDQLVNIFVNRGSTKVERARRLAPIYIQYGKLFNLRADIAWAQMCHETGFLEFTGDVKPEQNNFVGLGATGGGVPGSSFATEELGIIAHYAHLAWYYYPNHINQYCNLTYDPRHSGTTHWKYTGDTTIGFLNGRWAPGPTYTDKILQFANQIYGK